jgi:eukaryotic-like serine/threonine-protein kinase
MGTVWLAEDAELQREVAIKVLTVPESSDDFASRILAEARLLARLEHPNIVPIHDVGTLPDGRVFYVMTYVRGKRLDAWRTGTPSRPVHLRLFQKICDAVEFANARGVVHRDLKPENIMVGPFGEALVMDWGVARLQDSAERGGTVVGTPAYMAPEQARGDPTAIDNRADVYALGAILYYLLAGRPPHDPPADGSGLEALASKAPRPLREVDPEVPRPLEAICARAMARDPLERYATAREVSEDIDRFLGRLPVLAHRETPLERASRFLDRNRVLVYLVAAYLVMRAIVVMITAR